MDCRHALRSCWQSVHSLTVHLHRERPGRLAAKYINSPLIGAPVAAQAPHAATASGWADEQICSRQVQRLFLLQGVLLLGRGLQLLHIPALMSQADTESA